MTAIKITIETNVNASVETVWEAWTNPEHVMRWNHASDDWHCPGATNDLRIGGRFSFTMASKDGKMSFDFEGVYVNIEEHELIQYKIGDGREVKVTFRKTGEVVKVVETFEAEKVHSIEQQKAGWQAILDNFKKYTEQMEN